MALSCQLHGYLGFMSFSWHFLSRESAIKVPWNCFELCLVESLIFMALSFKPWNCQALSWHLHGRFMAWRCHENDMNMTWTWYSGFGKFSWQIRSTFIALSTKTEFQTVQVHGMFVAPSPKNCFKNCHNWFLSCLCLSICRQRFFDTIFTDCSRKRPRRVPSKKASSLKTVF